MRLWVDDERPAPDGWILAKTSTEAIDFLIELNKVDDDIRAGLIAISLDHDLGGDDTTRPVVMWMCENEYWPQRVYVHTANPVGREWLEGMVERYGPGVSRW